VAILAKDRELTQRRQASISFMWPAEMSALFASSIWLIPSFLLASLMFRARSSWICLSGGEVSMRIHFSLLDTFRLLALNEIKT